MPTNSKEDYLKAILMLGDETDGAVATTAIAAHGRQKAKRDQLFRVGEILREIVCAVAFRVVWASPPSSASPAQSGSPSSITAQRRASAGGDGIRLGRARPPGGYHSAGRGRSRAPSTA